MPVVKFIMIELSLWPFFQACVVYSIQHMGWCFRCITSVCRREWLRCVGASTCTLVVSFWIVEPTTGFIMSAVILTMCILTAIVCQKRQVKFSSVRSKVNTNVHQNPSAGWLLSIVSRCVVCGLTVIVALVDVSTCEVEPDEEVCNVSTQPSNQRQDMTWKLEVETEQSF